MSSAYPKQNPNNRKEMYLWEKSLRDVVNYMSTIMNKSKFIPALVKYFVFLVVVNIHYRAAIDEAMVN